MKMLPDPKTTTRMNSNDGHKAIANVKPEGKRIEDQWLATYAQAVAFVRIEGKTYLVNLATETLYGPIPEAPAVFPSKSA